MKSRIASVVAQVGAPVLPEGSGELLRCERCGERMIPWTDALGRLKPRCPRCDGVSKIPPAPHPDGAPMLQALVPAGVARTKPLPPPVVGERCAHCHQVVRKKPKRPKPCVRCKQRPHAKGRMICEACATPKPKVCRRCRVEFVRDARFKCDKCRNPVKPPNRCVDCRAIISRAAQRCKSCGRERLRKQRREWQRAHRPVAPERPCLGGCGAMVRGKQLRCTPCAKKHAAAKALRWYHEHKVLLERPCKGGCGTMVQGRREWCQPCAVERGRVRARTNARRRYREAHPNAKTLPERRRSA